VEKGGTPFLILEFVDGPTLQDLLKQGPLPPVVVAVVGAQLAAALEHAHFHRIIHRDLKPANVMLTRTGEVKLMDFGIARDEEQAALTKTGMAVGTPAYMSPEQVTGSSLDQRTDVYSLGVLLYECLAGVRAFSGQAGGTRRSPRSRRACPPPWRRSSSAPCRPGRTTGTSTPPPCGATSRRTSPPN
jgi:serine/threonine-protein kinase